MNVILKQIKEFIGRVKAILSADSNLRVCEWEDYQAALASK